MIDSAELIENVQPKDTKENFKIGTVTALFATLNTAKITFHGEDTVSEKQYSYLSSYVPKVNDVVLMAQLSGTYVILGKINYNVAPSTGGGSTALTGTTLNVTGETILGSRLGFFGGSTSSRISVNRPSYVTTNQVPDTTYSSNEQLMLNQLKTDMTSLRASVDSLWVALRNYNFI
jgi:hypothetical protein